MAIQDLNREQLLSLLATARAHSYRDFVMILVAFCHGLRASEVVALTPDNFSGGYLTVKRLKGSNKTTQSLVEHADPLLNEKKAVLEFLLIPRKFKRLFPITRNRFWQIIQRYGELAGIPKHLRHPHVLKHSIAMQTIEKAGIENVRQHLGHKVISSTGEYLKVSDERAGRAIRAAL